MRRLWRSCTPQSHRSEPRTSPVRHSEWTRTRTPSASCTSPITSATYTNPDGRSKACASKSPYGVGSRTVTAAVVIRRPFTLSGAPGILPRVTSEGRAVWFVGPRDVEIRSVSLPPVRAGQVLVRTAFSGISAGSEMLAYRGQLDPDMVLDESIGALGGT